MKEITRYFCFALIRIGNQVYHSLPSLSSIPLQPVDSFFSPIEKPQPREGAVVCACLLSEQRHHMRATIDLSVMIRIQEPQTAKYFIGPFISSSPRGGDIIKLTLRKHRKGSRRGKLGKTQASYYPTPYNNHRSVFFCKFVNANTIS